MSTDLTLTACCNEKPVETEGVGPHYRRLECSKCHQHIQWVKWPRVDDPDVQAEFVDRYKTIAEEKGYKVRWVGHQFKAIFGYWPPEQYGIPTKTGDND